MPTMERARLLDIQGRPLATAALTSQPDGVVAADARPSHELLAYYFGHGGRAVLIVQGEMPQPGRIVGTRWTPRGRVWLLQPEMPPAA